MSTNLVGTAGLKSDEQVTCFTPGVEDLDVRCGATPIERRGDCSFLDTHAAQHDGMVEFAYLSLPEQPYHSVHRLLSLGCQQASRRVAVQTMCDRQLSRSKPVPQLQLDAFRTVREDSGRLVHHHIGVVLVENPQPAGATVLASMALDHCLNYIPGPETVTDHPHSFGVDEYDPTVEKRLGLFSGYAQTCRQKRD